MQKPWHRRPLTQLGACIHAGSGLCIFLHLLLSSCLLACALLCSLPPLSSSALFLASLSPVSSSAPFLCSLPCSFAPCFAPFPCSPELSSSDLFLFCSSQSLPALWSSSEDSQSMCIQCFAAGSAWTSTLPQKEARAFASSIVKLEFRRPMMQLYFSGGGRSGGQLGLSTCIIGRRNSNFTIAISSEGRSSSFRAFCSPPSPSLSLSLPLSLSPVLAFPTFGGAISGTQR